MGNNVVQDLLWVCWYYASSPNGFESASVLNQFLLAFNQQKKNEMPDSIWTSELWHISPVIVSLRVCGGVLEDTRDCRDQGRSEHYWFRSMQWRRRRRRRRGNHCNTSPAHVHQLRAAYLLTSQFYTQPQWLILV